MLVNWWVEKHQRFLFNVYNFFVTFFNVFNVFIFFSGTFFTSMALTALLHNLFPLPTRSRFIARQYAMHAERDVVFTNHSVRLCVCPSVQKVQFRYCVYCIVTLLDGLVVGTSF